MPQTLTHPQERGRAAVGTCAASPTTCDAPLPLRLWHLASLDAPTVAVVWALAFAWAAGIRLPAWVPVLLALGTWTVYIGDRLLDARACLSTGATHRLRERHFFHWHHRRVLAPLAVASAVAAAVIIFGLMPLAIRERNSVLAVAALAYFSGVHAPRRAPRLPLLSKEFLVGVLFAAGCAFPTLSRLGLAGASRTAIAQLLVPAVLFAALAWLNCHAIEQWESAPSSRHASRILALAGGMGLCGSLLAASLAFAQPRAAALLAAEVSSALLLALLDRLRQRLSPIALRAAADLVLLTPLFCLLR